jgi:hypothetical protein
LTKQSIHIFFCHSFVNIFMSKKLLIYGLAFGSATAALSYIYMVAVASSPNGWQHLIAVLGEFLILPGTGIFLFLKSFKKQSPEQFMLGRAVFLGFFLSIIIGASVSLLYSYVSQFRPEIIAQLVDIKTNQFKTSKFFSTLSEKDVQLKYQEIKDNYTVRSQFIYQLFLGGSRGLFLSAIFAYFMKARMNRDY